MQWQAQGVAWGHTTRFWTILDPPLQNVSGVLVACWYRPRQVALGFYSTMYSELLKSKTKMMCRFSWYVYVSSWSTVGRGDQLTVKSPLNSQVQTSFAVFIYSISLLTNQSINGISIAPPPLQNMDFNFQIHSVSHSLTILVSIHLLVHFSTHLWHHPHTRHPSLLHSFTPGSKPIFSTNPFHRRFLLPTGLPHDNGTGPDLSRSSFYF